MVREEPLGSKATVMLLSGRAADYTGKRIRSRTPLEGQTEGWQQAKPSDGPRPVLCTLASPRDPERAGIGPKENGVAVRNLWPGLKGWEGRLRR